MDESVSGLAIPYRMPAKKRVREGLKAEVGVCVCSWHAIAGKCASTTVIIFVLMARGNRRTAAIAIVTAIVTADANSGNNAGNGHQ